MRRHLLNTLKQFLKALVSTMHRHLTPMPARNHAFETIVKLRGKVKRLKHERELLRITVDDLKGRVLFEERLKEAALIKIVKLENKFVDDPEIVNDLKLQLATLEQERETLGEEYYLQSLKYQEYKQEQEQAKELIAQMVKGMERN